MGWLVVVAWFDNDFVEDIAEGVDLMDVSGSPRPKNVVLW